MLPDNPRRSSDPVPVLMYHDIADGRTSQAFRRFVVPPALFAEHLLALHEAGYGTGHVSDLGAGPVARKVAFLTFDDGFGTIVEHALPALAVRAMTATLFLPTAFVGGRASWLSKEREDARSLLSWPDVRDAAAAGFEIGSHGHRHLEFDILDDRGLDQELTVSKRILEDETAAVVQSLAYPFGYHDSRVRSAAAGAGYRTACEVGYGLYERGDDPLRIRRLLIGPDMSAERVLELMADGGPTVGQRLRRHTRPIWRLARRARATARGAEPKKGQDSRSWTQTK